MVEDIPSGQMALLKFMKRRRRKIKVVERMQTINLTKEAKTTHKDSGVVNYYTSLSSSYV